MTDTAAPTPKPAASSKRDPGKLDPRPAVSSASGAVLSSA